MLSPLLFSIYTNDCTSLDSTDKLLKFADDTTIIGLIHDGDESAYRQHVDQIVSWCSRNNLHLNIGKTVEMIISFTKESTCFAPLKINGCTVSITDSYMFLGTTICSDLKWDNSFMHMFKKSQRRMYFLCHLKKYNLSRGTMCKFYRAMIESCSSFTVWYSSATQRDNFRLQRVVRMAKCIIGTDLPILQCLYLSRVRKRALRIVRDPLNPALNLFRLLPSGRRYSLVKTRTS